MRQPRSRRRRQMQRPRRAIPPRTLLNQVSEHLMAGNVDIAQALLDENPQLAMARQRRHNVFLSAFLDTGRMEFYHFLLNWVERCAENDLSIWRDDDHRIPVLPMAYRRHRGDIALLLLDRMPDKALRCYNHPLRLLQLAVLNLDLPFIERMLEHPRVRASFTRRVRNASHRELFGVWQVTAIAVERGLADVVLQVHKLAPAKVTSGVFAAKGLLRERFNDVDPRVRDLATQYEKDCRWNSVRQLIMARHRIHDEVTKRIGDLDEHKDLPLAHLPDGIFRLIIAFLGPDIAARDGADGRVTTPLILLGDV